MISKERAEEVNATVSLLGYEKASEQLGISVSSIDRYVRIATAKPQEVVLPKVFLFDIETFPAEGYFWGLWKQNIPTSMVKHPGCMCSWAGKWLFDSEYLGATLTPAEALKKNDKRIVEELWHYFEEADILIAHNGFKFDVPWANTRFLFHNLKPPAPYKIIDTYQVVKRNFRFLSNKIDFVNDQLVLSRKLDTGGFELWEDCMFGNQEAIDKMGEYNKNDVGILEELYVALRGWVKSHPNMAMYMESDGPICPNCGNDEVEYAGYYYANVNRYVAWRCKECGAIGRQRKTEGGKNALISVAR